MISIFNHVYLFLHGSMCNWRQYFFFVCLYGFIMEHCLRFEVFLIVMKYTMTSLICVNLYIHTTLEGTHYLWSSIDGR